MTPGQETEKPARLPCRRVVFHEVVIAAVISLVIGSTSMSMNMAAMPSRLVISLVIAAADFSPRIVREDVPSPRNPSLGLHPSRIAQDGRWCVPRRTR